MGPGQGVGTGDSKSDLEDSNSEYELSETSKPFFPYVSPFMHTQGCYEEDVKWGLAALQ